MITKKFETLINKTIKTVFKLPNKGKLEPIKQMFYMYQGQEVIKRSFINNIKKWGENFITSD